MRWAAGSSPSPATPLLVGLVAIATQVPDVVDGATPTSHTTWVSALSLEFSFRLDGFATVMALLVTGIGVVVLVYSWDYFAGDRGSATVPRFAGYFTLFAGAMLGLVVADDLWTLFVFWELTSVTSFLLIGLDDELAGARAAAQRALLVTGAGGLAMLGGFVCLDAARPAPSNLQGVLGSDPTSTTAQVGLVLVLVGAFAKSAQFPFHFWLPGAMAAPTPVSAFLHSATMVKAGVVIVARFAPAFAELGWWRPVLVVVGGVTMLARRRRGAARDDAKQSLAFGTVSQLGLLVVLFGVGDARGDRGRRRAARRPRAVQVRPVPDGRRGRARHREPRTCVGSPASVARLPLARRSPPPSCTLSMIGLPPLLGFLGKESALAALVDGERLARRSRSSWSSSGRC